MTSEAKLVKYETPEYGEIIGDEPTRHFPEVVAGWDPVYDIKEFHRKFKQAYDGPPRALPLDLFNFRAGFLQEEIDEFSEAYHLGDNAKVLDALVDLVYVALGTAELCGYDFREAWRRVHRANMGKVIANPEGDERSHRDVKFDIVKPEGWLPPNHDDLV